MNEFQQPRLSSDGYIRLPFDQLSKLRFIHVGSDLDSHILADLKAQAVPATQAGFSEWVSDTTPPITVGWRWFVHSSAKRVLQAPEAINSNVMLTDLKGYDLGPVITANLMNTWLAIHDWQNDVSTVLHHL
jgi:hypothetical protein